MKAFIGSFAHQHKSWPHPSLDGEVDPAQRDHDEHIQADILTSGM